MPSSCRPQAGPDQADRSLVAVTNPESVDVPHADATVPTLVRIYAEALGSFAEVADALTPDQWEADSPCPGWTVADVVAHVIGIERELHGEALPEHEPDWGSLPHTATLFSRYTEIPVDLRRTVPPSEVLAELHEVIAWRVADLESEPDEPMAAVRGPGGIERDRDTLLRFRILDIWLHEQDVRTAIGAVGGLGTDAAWVTAGRLLLGMLRAWAKHTAAPQGSSVRLHVTGPGVSFDRTVCVGDDGRGAFVPPTVEPGEPTVSMTMPWPLFWMLAAGRIGAADQARAGEAKISGDAGLASRFLDHMAVTP